MLLAHPGLALAILGAVFLVVTGGEALYADMGHFGRTPGPSRLADRRLAGTAAQLLRAGSARACASSGRRESVSSSSRLPARLPGLLILATLATVIASQATISGAFSITRQAVQLDLLPRVKILQTSADERGQIYVPATNTIMFIAVVAFVLGFGSSSAISGAYGASVIGTMLITTLLGAVAAATAWKWPAWRIALVFGLFSRGRPRVRRRQRQQDPDRRLGAARARRRHVRRLRHLARRARAAARRTAAPRGAARRNCRRCSRTSTRVPGTAVFLVSHHGFVPTALLRNLEHNRVCHENDRDPAPRDPAHAAPGPRLAQLPEEVLPGIHLVHARFGFMETPDVDDGACRRGAQAACASTRTARSSSAGTSCVRARARGIAGMKMRLFAYMQRRSAQAAEFFRMPTKRVVVLATEVEICSALQRTRRSRVRVAALHRVVVVDDLAHVLALAEVAARPEAALEAVDHDRLEVVPVEAEVLRRASISSFVTVVLLIRRLSVQSVVEMRAARSFRNVCSSSHFMSGIGLQVARQADLERDAPVGDVVAELLHVALAVLDLRVADLARLEQVGAVADAVRVQVRDRLEDRLRPVGLARVHGALQEMLVRVLEGCLVRARRITGFLAREIEADDLEARGVSRASTAARASIDRGHRVDVLRPRVRVRREQRVVVAG